MSKKITMNTIALMVAKLEGGKREIDIAQIKQILKVLAFLLKRNPEAAGVFLSYVLKSK